MLERGDERKLDRLALLVASLRCRREVVESERFVGIGVDPDRFEQWLGRAVVGIGGGAIVDGQHARRPPLDELQARVGGDRVEPGAQRAAALESGQPPPGAQKGLLERILGVRHRTEHPVAVRLELAPIFLDQAPEGAFVA